MKRPFLLREPPVPLIAAGSALIAATYGLVRMAYGLFLPDVQAELGLDVATAGGISAGASVVYCFGALAGFLTAARHARMLVIAAAVAASVGALGMALSGSSLVFGVFAIASSAGAGLASPALVAVLQRDPATARSPRAQAMVNAGTGPGVVLAGALALLLAPDWRLAWALAAVVTIVAAAGVLVTDKGRADAAAPPAALPSLSWFVAHRGVLVAALLLGAGSAAVWTFGRTFLLESGMTPAVSMAAWIALGVGGTIVITTARWVARLAPRVAWMLAAGIVAVGTAGVLAGGVWALVAFAVFGWGLHRRQRRAHSLDGVDRPAARSGGDGAAVRHADPRAGARRGRVRRARGWGRIRRGVRDRGGGFLGGGGSGVEWRADAATRALSVGSLSDETKRVVGWVLRVGSSPPAGGARLDR